MELLGNKISRIVSVNREHLSVVLRFSDGFSGHVSLKHIFEKPKGLASEVLKGNMFDKCFVESGALAWPNGLELCPDALKQWSILQQKNLKKKAA